MWWRAWHFLTQLCAPPLSSPTHLRMYSRRTRFAVSSWIDSYSSVASCAIARSSPAGPAKFGLQHERKPRVGSVLVYFSMISTRRATVLSEVRLAGVRPALPCCA